VIEKGAHALAVYFAAVAAERAGGEGAGSPSARAQADWIAEHALVARTSAASSGAAADLRLRCGAVSDPRLLVRLVLASPARFATTAALVRLVSGAIFLGFGLAKFTDHESETQSFTSYGLPSPSAFAYAIGVLELGLGLLLLLGLLTRLAALGLAGDMVGAIVAAGPVEGGAINLALAPALLVAMLFLAWTGAGRFALDERLGRLRTRPARAAGGGPRRPPSAVGS